MNGYGWIWVPGPRYVSWCPGAVNWVQGTQWVRWVPLAPHEPWYGYGHGGVNVFVSKNFGHRGSVTYLPPDSFVNGTPARGFRSPRDPYADGRIIAGQPRVTPTPASRMPVAGNPTPRVFTNGDLEARRNLRERIGNVGGNSGSQDPSAEMERRRQERSRVNSGTASGFANNVPATSGRFPASPRRPKPHQHALMTTGVTTPTPLDPSSASGSIAWMLPGQALPNSETHPPPGHVLRLQCLIHQSILRRVLPQTQTTDPLPASACMKCIVGERTQAEPIVTRHSPVRGRPRQLATILTHRHHLLQP